MFKTKRDVDRHVSHILNKIRDEKERNSRGFQFAKLYYNIGDNESAKRYVQAFLSVRETVPQAHKLLGQIYEALRHKEYAVEAYKRSLDLDSEQKDIILKVCELYGDPTVPVNREHAKFWVELAEKYYPNHLTVFKLKERLIRVDGRGDAGELEHLFSSELVKNPQDVKLHVKLLRLYIKSRNVEQAYDHAVQTEKTLAFVDSIEWYDCLADIYQVYQDQEGINCDVQFYINKLFALANLAHLRLKAEDRNMTSCVEAIHQLDLDLHQVSKMGRQSSEWESYLYEMTGQLFFLIGTLLLKRAAKGQVSWKDACSFSAVCYLLSDSFPAINCKTCWFNHVSADRKKFYERLYMTGCDRLSQGGHMIYSLLSKQDGSLWAKELRQELCTQQGKENLFSLLFTGSDMKRKQDRSFLLKSDKFTKTSLDIPSKDQLAQYDAVAYTLHCNDLNYLVWLALQHHTAKDSVQPDYDQLYGYRLFKDMKYSVPDLSSGDPGTLCQLDIQTFFYASVHWSAIQKVERSRNLHPIPDKPDVLPVCLSPPLASQQQCDWWSAVYTLESKTASEKFSKLWGILMRGLETIRLVAPHTLPLNIVMHVARTLDQRARETESLDAEGIVTPKLSGLQGRAGFYWKASANLLSRLERGQLLKMPKDCLFPGEISPDPAQLKELKEQSNFAMATVAMREGRHEEALKGFETMYTPQAAYYTGMIYKNLAEDVDLNGNSSTDENSQQMALLMTSKSSFYQALDRLGSDRHELKDDITRNLNDVVCKLISLESGGAIADSILSANSQNYSTAESEVDSQGEQQQQQPKTVTPKTPASPFISPVLAKSLQKQPPVYPSPNRLEAQMKALELSNQAQGQRITSLEDMVQKLMQELLIQLRESREENKFLREQLNVMQGASMTIPRTPMPSYPGTPQVRTSLMGQMPPQPYQQSPGQYAFGAQGPAIPSHLPQFGSYGIGSPARPGSAFGQTDIEDDFNNVDGEYYDPEDHGQYFVPDSSLVQDWPFGHKAGVEGKSTITYAPQGSMSRGFGQADPGMMANALRGQSIQYGNIPAQQGPAVRPAMPGPGFFAQSTQQPSQPAVSQAPSQPFGGMMGLGSQGQSPAMSPKPPALSTGAVSKPPTTSIMPPNAVASPSVTTKPRLIPESVGVPSPKPGEKPTSQSTTLSQQQAGQGIFGGKAISQAQVPISEGPATSSSLLASLLTDPKLAGQSSAGFAPGSAASVLNTLAMKHQQEASKTQTTSAAPTVATTAQGTPQKTVFSGFSFTSTPKINEPKVEEKPKPVVTTSAPAEKPFSGFSFTLPSKSTATTPSTKTETPKSAPQAPTSSATSGFVLGQGGSSPTFASIAAGGGPSTSFGGTGGGDFKGFQGAGQALFGKSLSPTKGNKSLDEDHVDEYEPEVDFKPVVPLPALVTVKTGEEDEEKLFGERTKLFRFDTESNQWKERGIGDLKILKHKETGRIRILMRREQVLKVCANHTISSDMKLSTMSSSDKAWCWNAADYSEGEMRREQLAAKFKNADIAARFKEVFEECLAEIAAAEKKPVEEAKPKESEKPKTGKNDLSSMFTKKAGSWSCDGCLITNEGDVLKCPCCGTLKPGVKPEDIKEEKPSGFGKFGAASGESGFKFGSSGGTAQTGSSQSGSGFKFGAPASTGEKTVTQSGSFKFGSQSTVGTEAAVGKPATGFKFGTTSTTDTAKPATGGFKFGVQPSDATESKESVKDNTETKTLDLSKQATSAGFMVDKDSSKYTFETPSKSTDAKKENDESKTCDTKPNLLAHLLDTQNSMWKCDKCLVNNDDKEQKCVCCGEVRPGAKPDTAPAAASSALSKFSAKPGGGFNIGGFGSTPSTSSGFTFGSSQVSDKPKEEESAKPKGFSFGNASKSGGGFAFGTPTKAEPFKFEPDKNKMTSTSSEGFNFSLSMTPTMPHSGRSPLKSPGVKSPRSPEGGDDEYYLNEEDNIFFEPVIPLPDKVEVKTGEEGEEVLYSHRAKLFRFVNGEWKERGLGDIKVLYDSSENKARILMRREQILKICCNHYISQDLSLKIMPNSKDCAMVWYAMDFADGEQKAENFSCKFKTADIAQQFKEAVEKAKSRLNGETLVSPVKEKAKTSEVETIGASTTSSDDDVIFVKEECSSQEDIQKARKYLLPDNFYMYLSKTPCPGCRGCDSDNFEMKTVTQDGQVAKNEMKVKEGTKVKVETIKQSEAAENEEGDEEYVINEEDYEEDYDEEEDEDSDDEYETEEEEEDEENVEEGSDQVETVGARVFGGAATTGSPVFGSGAKGSPVFGAKASPVFGGGAKETPTFGSVSANSPVFGGGNANGFSFSSLASKADPNAFGGNKDENKPFSWQGAGQKLFGQGGDHEDGSGGEGEGDDSVVHGEEPHFEPIVPLPELVEVKTGEEEEKAVFAYRAKLFRFDGDANQWKEKGLGEMKILQHKENGTYRLLLRREQVHKLACNHRLTPDLAFKPLNTSETSWCWTAQDYSEGEPKIEQLAVKFKTIDQAKEFKYKLDEIQDEMRKQWEANREEAATAESGQTVTWNVRIHTSEARRAGTDANVGICLYGDKGQSGDIMLESTREMFEKGCCDVFDVEMPDVGLPYKLRVFHDDKGRSAGWHLEKVEMENMSTKEEYEFICNKWLASDEEGHTIVREMPAQGPGIDTPLPLVKYIVQVYTGDVKKAGTDANVSITIYGERGDTGCRKLIKSNTNLNKWEGGQMDEVEFEAVSVLKISKIKIGHDNAGYNPGWFLNKVIVKQDGAPEYDTEFICDRWFAKEMDDGLLERELTPS